MGEFTVRRTQLNPQAEKILRPINIKYLFVIVVVRI